MVGVTKIQFATIQMTGTSAARSAVKGCCIKNLFKICSRIIVVILDVREPIRQEQSLREISPSPESFER